VIDYFHLVRPLDGSDIRENLRAPGGRRIEWSALEVLKGLNRILRSLGHQVVADAVLEIQENIGVIWKLPLSEFNMLLATSRSV